MQFQDCHQQRREAQLAREARLAIREEVTNNRTQSYEVLLSNETELQHVRDVLAATHAATGFIDFNTPSLLSAAWDSAQAAHALSAMPLAETQGIAAVYKHQEELSLQTRATSQAMINAFVEFREDDESESGRKFLLRYQRTLSVLVNTEHDLIAAYDEALR